MSFLKITDPKRRDFIVNEFLKTRQTIQQNFLSERVGDLSTQCELSKLFKPVTNMQKDLKCLVSELKPIRERMKNLPKAIHFHNFRLLQPMMMMMVKKRRMYSYEILPSNICESLLPCLEQIRHFDCGIRMVSFTFGTRKQK